MKRKDFKPKRVKKLVRDVCKGRKRELIAEVIIVMIIVALFVAGITKIILDETRGRNNSRYTAEIVPGAFTSIVTKTNMQNSI